MCKSNKVLAHVSIGLWSALMLIMISPFQSKAEECSTKTEGFERGECYLQNDNINSYFNYITAYFEGVRDEEGEYDPRLGFRFLEKVAKHEVIDYAEMATEMYNWGLRAREVEPFRKLLEREIIYLTPLLTSDELDDMMELLDAGDPEVYTKLRGFWNSENVVLSTEVNERMIEHWQRIHHAKIHFTENERTIYNTDERGSLYVRLGEPNDRRSGRFGGSTSEIRARLYDLQGKGFFHGSSAVFQKQQEIMTSTGSPGYEIWFYDDIDPRQRDRIFFLFGEQGGEGHFGLRESVEDFMPRGSFSQAVVGQRGRGGTIRTSNFLQFMFYNDLSTYHSFFGSQLRKYDRAWHRYIGQGRIQGQPLRNSTSRQSANRETRDVYEQAPISKSGYERQLNTFDSDILTYRFLNNQKQPELYVVIHSGPQAIYDQYNFTDASGDMMQRDYDMQIKQGVIYYGKENRELERNMYRLNDIYSNLQGVLSEPVTGHPIQLVDGSEADNFVAFSELYLAEPKTEDAERNRFLVGLNKYQSDSFERFDPNSTEFKLSDIVLGSPQRDTIHVRGEAIGILEEGNRVYPGENLQIYFEAYNFDTSENGISEYEVEYSIEERGRSWWPFSSSSVKSVTFESITESWRSEHYFEVDHGDLEPGNYTIKIQLREHETERETERSKDFRVLRVDN